MENTPAMSDHVVVKREALEFIIPAAHEEAQRLYDKKDFDASEPLTVSLLYVESVIRAPSPEMVPMEEVEKILEDTEQYLRDNIPTTSWGLLDKPADRDREVLLDGLAAFNAKFKV